MNFETAKDDLKELLTIFGKSIIGYLIKYSIYLFGIILATPIIVGWMIYEFLTDKEEPHVF